MIANFPFFFNYFSKFALLLQLFNCFGFKTCTCWNNQRRNIKKKKEEEEEQKRRFLEVSTGLWFRMSPDLCHPFFKRFCHGIISNNFIPKFCFFFCFTWLLQRLKFLCFELFKLYLGIKVHSARHLCLSYVATNKNTYSFNGCQTRGNYRN